MAGTKMNDTICGMVWLVGAGPGDPGLMTVRGAELLRGADVIVRDRLIGRGITEYFRRDAKLIDVGKRAGNHSMEQEKIEEILIREASAGKKVVRLKGGDPFLFGRGGEEMLALAGRGIQCEVVPGVSSAIAVPSCAGIPITHRGVSSGAYITTAHRASGYEGLDYERLAGLNDTIVLLMSSDEISKISNRLMEAGMSPDTPVAIISDGTTAKQRETVSNLRELAAEADEKGRVSPAVIVIGRAVALGEAINRRASLPLRGRRVWLTMTERGNGRNHRLASLLRDSGAEVIRIPCVETRPRDVSLRSHDLGRFDWFVFSSRAGAENFFRQMRRNGIDIRTIAGVKIAAVGPVTKEALEERGLIVDFVPLVNDGEHTAAGIIEMGAGRVLLLRCFNSPCTWKGILAEHGIDVEEIGLYETAERPSSSFGDCAPGDIAVFASASAVSVFTGRGNLRTDGIRAVCVGRPSAAAAREAGFEDVMTASRATDDALFEAVLGGGERFS
jgi:uroporphyrinogen III methyltransferase/synthase